MHRMWMVRAGRGGRCFADFVEQGIVALGWARIGDPTRIQSQDGLATAFRAAYPDWTETQVMVASGQVHRFVNEFKIGDNVVIYDGHQRSYLVGQIVGPATYRESAAEELTCERQVIWGTALQRDALSQESRNTLAAYQSLFLLPDYSCIEIESRLAGVAPPPVAETPEAMNISDPFEDITERALERLKDRLIRLTWNQMQEAAAALLRALGYRTKISPQGADRGRDVFASPDGFGFEQPRILVEVKHRRGQAIGAPEVRSFLGGLHRDDRGLYVSTGGFTREAYYEAERASVPITLMTLDDLARAIMDNYESFDSAGRALIPLVRIYWPE